MYSYFDGVKKELKGESFNELFLDPTKTAVITIDMHEGHLSEDPECPSPAPRGREIIQPINKFTEKCRVLGIPVIHVKSVLRKDGADDIKGFKSAWRILSQMRDSPLLYTDYHALEGSKWTEFSVYVDEKDYIVDGKKRLSAFYPTDLELLLRNLRVESIVLTGALTDCCVLNTACDGANRDFRVVVPQDLTRGNIQLEESALQIISRYFGLVVDSEDLIHHWEHEKSVVEK